MMSFRILTRQITTMRQPCTGRALETRLPAGRCQRQYASKNAVGKPKGTSTLKLALIGVTLGGATGTIYSLYNNWRDQHAHKEHERIPPVSIDHLPRNVRITKRFVNPTDDSGLEVILFQFQTCPFCCKVRAFLDYAGISYSVVEVDAVLRQDIKWSDQRKVPMVLVRQRDGRYLQMTDSSAIISLLASYLNDKSVDVGELAQFYPTVSFFNDDGKKKLDIMNKYFLMYQANTPTHLTRDMQESERKWRNWADSHLVHLISPNCYQTLDQAFETFEWFSEAGEWEVHFPHWERDLMVNVGAVAMWLISKVLKKRHGLTDDVRSHLYEALNRWSNELKKRKRKFMGGDQPNLADLAVYGVLCSMEGCVAFKDCLQNTHIGEWFYNVKELVERNRGILIRERIDGDGPVPVSVGNQSVD